MIEINFYHLHTEDALKYFEFLNRNIKFRIEFTKVSGSAIKNNRATLDVRTKDELITYFKTLSNHIGIKTKKRVMNQAFGI